MIPVCGMAYTRDQLAQLEAAIASGVLTIEHDGPNGTRRVQTFQSLSAMENLRARMIRELGGAPAFRLGATNKGLNTSPSGRFGSGSGDGNIP